MKIVVFIFLSIVVGVEIKKVWYNIGMEITDQLQRYMELLLEYNQKVNLVSRKITSEGLNQLLEETFFLNNHLNKHTKVIVDAGSGNGLLGIPLSFWNKDVRVKLIEPRKKKAEFLHWIKSQLNMDNIEVFHTSIEEYLKKYKREKRTLIARGFPDLSVFAKYIKNGLIHDAILITSDIKIKKNQLHLESVRKKTYNVPLRENLKIFKMENVSGEPKQKK